MKLVEKSDDSVVAVERVKARGAKGIMKVRTMKLAQLFMVFANSPQGGGDGKTSVPTGVGASRLHKTKDKEFTDFMAAGTDQNRPAASVTTEISSKEPDASSACPVLREERLGN